MLLQSLIAFPKVKRQVLLCEPEAKQPKDFTDNTMFWVNQEFGIMWVVVVAVCNYNQGCCINFIAFFRWLTACRCSLMSLRMWILDTYIIVLWDIVVGGMACLPLQISLMDVAIYVMLIDWLEGHVVIKTCATYPNLFWNNWMKKPKRIWLTEVYLKTVIKIEVVFLWTLLYLD